MIDGHVKRNNTAEALSSPIEIRTSVSSHLRKVPIDFFARAEKTSPADEKSIMKFAFSHSVTENTEGRAWLEAKQVENDINEQRSSFLT